MLGILVGGAPSAWARSSDCTIVMASFFNWATVVPQYSQVSLWRPRRLKSDMWSLSSIRCKTSASWKGIQYRKNSEGGLFSICCKASAFWKEIEYHEHYKSLEVSSWHPNLGSISSIRCKTSWNKEIAFIIMCVCMGQAHITVLALN